MKVDYYLNGLPYFTTAPETPAQPETPAAPPEPNAADYEKAFLELLTEHEKREGIKRAERNALEKIAAARVYCLEKLRDVQTNRLFIFWVDRLNKTYEQERRARDYFTRLLNATK